ncbi:hypothetical protein [Geminisphaera colitermitum]|uniref:hypothetical protein n=1 Tax=Geminisphaera colitermitum TaxID=1148786 RepID=UPI0002FD5EF6|nr:hypothetical protein [Geminisphaera colitermitum]
MSGNGNPPPPPPAASYIPETPPPPPSDEADSPRTGASGTPPPASEAVPADTDPVGSPEDTAETAAAALYLVTGVATGEMDEATPSATEHRSFVRVLGSYLRARGWRFVGIFAIGAALVAYLIKTAMRPKTAAKIKRWRDSWGSKDDPLATAKPVTPVKHTTPAPAPSAPPSTGAKDPFATDGLQ